jgi:hypothetical protein
LPEEAFLNEASQQTPALIRVDLEQPRGLLNGRGESPHLNELTAHARFDITMYRRG